MIQKNEFLTLLNKNRDPLEVRPQFTFFNRVFYVVLIILVKNGRKNVYFGYFRLILECLHKNGIQYPLYRQRIIIEHKEKFFWKALVISFSKIYKPIY